MLNKILKSLIAFFLISFIAFLAIGIPKTKHVLETSIFIEAPVEEVFNFMTDIDNNKKWRNGFISIDKARGDGFAAGNSYDLSVTEFGKVIEIKESITEVIPNSKIAFDISKNGVEETVNIFFESKDKGTQVKEVHHIQGQDFPSRFIIKIFKKDIHNGIMDNYETLKKVIEKQMSNEKDRCPWPGTDELYVRYHDKEWGVPELEDKALFAKLILDGAQAGLSWITILRRTQNYFDAFDGLDPEKMALYDEAKIEMLLQDAGIIRNRLKVNAAVTNARAYLKLVEDEGSFSQYLWQFTNGKVIVNHLKGQEDFMATSPESDAMSKDLKKRGFKFVGSTICYAFMQAVGMVNDHLVTCFRHSECIKQT